MSFKFGVICFSGLLIVVFFYILFSSVFFLSDVCMVQAFMMLKSIARKWRRRFNILHHFFLFTMSSKTVSFEALKFRNESFA